MKIRTVPIHFASFVTQTSSFGYGDYIGKVSWHINLNNLSEFSDLNSLEDRARELKISEKYAELDEREKRGIDVLLGTIDGEIEDFFENR